MKNKKVQCTLRQDQINKTKPLKDAHCWGHTGAYFRSLCDDTVVLKINRLFYKAPKAHGEMGPCCILCRDELAQSEQGEVTFFTELTTRRA